MQVAGVPRPNVAKACGRMKTVSILIVESDREARESMARALDGGWRQVCHFADAETALEHVRAKGLPQVALVAQDLPGLDSADLAANLKSRADIPIILMLSGSDADLIVDSLSRQGDDFVVKPFALGELMARVRILLARQPAVDYADEPVHQVDDYLRIDFARNCVTVDGKVVGLTPTESVLLHTLARNAPHVVPSETLLSRAWSADEVYEDTLRVHMHRLRRKVEIDSHYPQYIRTERGVGYRFTQLLYADEGAANGD